MVPLRGHSVNGDGLMGTESLCIGRQPFRAACPPYLNRRLHAPDPSERPVTRPP